MQIHAPVETLAIDHFDQHQTDGATGEQTGVKSSQSGCGSVTVTRKRTFVDGKTDTDTFKASYDCDPPEH